MQIRPNKIYNRNCLDILPKIPDKSIDLVFADPPYNGGPIGPERRTYSKGKMKIPRHEYKSFCLEWFNQTMRISRNVVVTPGITNTHIYPQPDWQICFYKPNTFAGNKLGGYNVWEPVFVYGKSVINGGIGQDFIKATNHESFYDVKTKHPCPKNLNLIIWIVEKFSRKNKIVLDPFVGSGTTLAACEILHRQWIGIDNNKSYCQLSKKRVQHYQI